MATVTNGAMPQQQVEKVLGRVVETRRKRTRVSQRTAAARAGMSEATWRQLVAGGVSGPNGWVNRHPRRDQVLAMAHAVGALDEVAKAIAATKDEVEATRSKVVIPDPAEEEIMGMRHLGPREKLRLIEELAALRKQV